MTHAVCAECKKEFDYELTPGFPRKYCVECGAIRKAAFATKQINQPITTQQPGQVLGEVKQLPVQTAKHDVVISRTEKPHSYEFGPANQRHKIYYGEVIELVAHIASLKSAELLFNELE